VHSTTRSQLLALLCFITCLENDFRPLQDFRAAVKLDEHYTCYVRKFNGSVSEDMEGSKLIIQVTHVTFFFTELKIKITFSP
jgi:hypothetical protein